MRMSFKYVLDELGVSHCCDKINTCISENIKYKWDSGYQKQKCMKMEEIIFIFIFIM